MMISSKGLNLIKEFEGCRLSAYQCSAGVWTIGWGHTDGVREFDTISQEEADSVFLSDVNYIAVDPVNSLVLVPVNQNQFDALCSFTYNLGQGNLASSTLLKLLNQGDYEGAQAEFPKWNLAGGVPSDGLTRRREAEAELFGSID